MNQKKNLKREERKKSNQQNGPFSLSRTKFKGNCKTNSSCASIFVQEVPRINPTRFWHGYNCYFSKYAKHIYMAYSFPISKNAYKMFPKPKTRVMVGYYTSLAFNLCLGHKFWKCIIAPIIWNANCSIIGISWPLNKITFSTSTKYRTNGMLSLHFL